MMEAGPTKPRPKKRYASDSQIDRVLNKVKDQGLDVAAVRMDADGGVTIYDRKAFLEQETGDAAQTAIEARRQRKGRAAGAS